MKISLWLTPALLMIAIVMVMPITIAAATTNATQPAPAATESGSFFDIFPWYIWLIFGLVFAALIVLVVILLFAPKKKPGTAAGPGAKQGVGQQGPGAQKIGTKQMPPPQGQMRPGMPPQQQRMQPQMNQQMNPQQGFGGQQPNTQPQMMNQQQGQMGQPGMGGAQFNKQPPQPGMMPQSQPQMMNQPQSMRPRAPGAAPQPMQQPQQMAPQQINPMQPRMAPQQPAQMQGQQARPRPMAQQMPQQQAIPQQPMQQPMRPRPAMAPQPMQQPQQMPIQQQPMQPRMAPTQPQMRQPMPQPGFVPQQQGFGAKTRPVFSIGNLNIFPSQVKEGDPVTVSAVITNSGSSTGKYSAVLRIDNVVENIAELTLNPGASQTATFSIIKDAPGEYVVEVDNLRGTLFVIPKMPAAFTTSNLTISPDRISQGRPVAIGVTITNTGEKPGIYNAVLKIKGITEISEDIPMEPLETKEVVFNVVKDAAGFFPVSFEHMTGRFVVEMDWTP
jgi:hypothetical protein